jgi:hypothetical protein
MSGTAGLMTHDKMFAAPKLEKIRSFSVSAFEKYLSRDRGTGTVTAIAAILRSRARARDVR